MVIFVNSHNLISWQCVGIVRRKLLLATIGTSRVKRVFAEVQQETSAPVPKKILDPPLLLETFRFKVICVFSKYRLPGKLHFTIFY